MQLRASLEPTLYLLWTEGWGLHCTGQLQLAMNFWLLVCLYVCKWVCPYVCQWVCPYVRLSALNLLHQVICLIIILVAKLLHDHLYTVCSIRRYQLLPLSNWLIPVFLILWKNSWLCFPLGFFCSLTTGLFPPPVCTEYCNWWLCIYQ